MGGPIVAVMMTTGLALAAPAAAADPDPADLARAIAADPAVVSGAALAFQADTSESSGRDLDQRRGRDLMLAEYAAGTTYDGATPILTAATPITRRHPRAVPRRLRGRDGRGR